MIASAARIPSEAALMMPPAYPAPSPTGIRPVQPTLSRFSPRVMRTGEL